MKNQSKIYSPKKGKFLRLLLISSIFFAGGVVMLEDKPIAGWIGVLFSGLGIVVFLIQLYPNSSYLKLTNEGFEVKNLFRTHFTKWSEVKDFRLGDIHGNKMIFFDFTDEHKTWRNGKKLAKFLSGKEGAIQSIYNISTDKLLELMMEYHLKNK